MNVKKSLVTVVVALALVMLACGNGGPANLTPSPAQQLMPNIVGYKSAKTQNVEAAVMNAVGGAAAISGNPAMGAVIKGVDSISQCYQNKGVVDIRVYSNEQEPLSAGAITIIDKKLATDPKVFLQCATGLGFSASDIQPCTYSYSLQNKDSNFYIAYVGSTTQICADFCSNLEGCAKSQ